MRLQKIQIDRESYGSKEGTYAGIMVFKADDVQIEVKLNHAVCIEVLLAAQNEIKLLAAVRASKTLHDISVVLDPLGVDEKPDAN